MNQAACLLILNENTLNIRVVNRRNSNLLGLPGGKVEPGEDTLHAAIRETHEETGLLFKPEDCVLLYTGNDGNFEVTTYLTLSDNEETSEGSEPGIISTVVDWQDFVYRSAFQQYNRKIIDRLRSALMGTA